MRKFLIIPGLPRCATTSFANVLKQHPAMFLPVIKEPHYFLPGRESFYMFNKKGIKVPFKKCGFINNEQEYLKNYNYFKDDKIFIDASTLYAVHSNSIDNIKSQKNIEPYFIILKRDPFKRAVSHYLYSISRNEEFRSFEKAMEEELQELHPRWLLGGYIAGSNADYTIKKIAGYWGDDHLLVGDVDTNNIFTNEFTNKIVSFFKLTEFEFNFNINQNQLMYTNNKFVQNMRIAFKKIRQLNPFIFDNRFLRGLFEKFMKGVSVQKDLYAQFDYLKDKYFENYYSFKSK